MVGDVAGHGPDEAALGVALRIGWRALTFAGLRGNERMRQLERILRAESPGTGIFATVLSIALSPDDLQLHRGPRRPSRHAAARPRLGASGWSRPRARARPRRHGLAGRASWSCPRGTVCCC